MIDLEALVGKENMQINRKQQVIAILKKIDQPATTKRYLYARWARLVGYHPIVDDLDDVAEWGQS